MGFRMYHGFARALAFMGLSWSVTGESLWQIGIGGLVMGWGAYVGWDDA